MDSKITSLLLAACMIFCGFSQVEASQNPSDLDIILLAQNLPKGAVRDAYGYSRIGNVVADVVRNAQSKGGPTEAQKAAAAKDSLHAKEEYVVNAKNVEANFGNNLLGAVIEGRLYDHDVASYCSAHNSANSGGCDYSSASHSSFDHGTPGIGFGSSNHVIGDCGSRSGGKSSGVVSRSTGGFVCIASGCDRGYHTNKKGCRSSVGASYCGGSDRGDGGNYCSSDFMGHD